jgi:hypothetical protein
MTLEIPLVGDGAPRIALFSCRPNVVSEGWRDQEGRWQGRTARRSNVWLFRLGDSKAQKAATRCLIQNIPIPKLPEDHDDHHGTRCAGQIGAVIINVCGVGIAYKSKVAGIRILSETITDVDEAAALNYRYHNTSS